MRFPHKVRHLVLAGAPVDIAAGKSQKLEAQFKEWYDLTVDLPGAYYLQGVLALPAEPPRNKLRCFGVPDTVRGREQLFGGDDLAPRRRRRAGRSDGAGRKDRSAAPAQRNCRWRVTSSRISSPNSSNSAPSLPVMTINFLAGIYLAAIIIWLN
jgi:hypothetical protein